MGIGSSTKRIISPADAQALLGPRCCAQLEKGFKRLQYDGPKYPIRVNWEGMKLNLYPCTNLHAGQQTADIALAFGVWQCGRRRW